MAPPPDSSPETSPKKRRRLLEKSESILSLPDLSPTTARTRIVHLTSALRSASAKVAILEKEASDRREEEDTKKEQRRGTVGATHRARAYTQSDLEALFARQDAERAEIGRAHV